MICYFMYIPYSNFTCIKDIGNIFLMPFHFHFDIFLEIPYKNLFKTQLFLIFEIYQSQSQTHFILSEKTNSLFNHPISNYN